MRKIHIIIYLLCWMTAHFPIELNAQRSELRKMSPTIRQMFFDASGVASGKSLQPASDLGPKVMVFMKSEGDVSELMSHCGCEVHATAGDISIVAMPVRNIGTIASDSRVKRIETGRGMRVSNATIATAINSTQAHHGLRLPQAFTGKGVVMGIQDIGFDLTNPNFYSADMSRYRIKAFWDMLSTDTIGSRMPVGNEYTDSISLLAYSHSRDSKYTTHGSHTLGTAAGSGYNSKYRGIAYDSDICLVSNYTGDLNEMISEEESYKYTYATDVLGFKYIFDYAQSVGKPCVISFSEGGVQDLYGDDILYYEMINRLVGPGRIIVASAGNNNLEPSFIHKPKGLESTGTFLERWGNMFYFMADTDKEMDSRLVLYGTERDTLSVSTQWLCQQPDSLAFDTLSVDGVEYTFIFGAYPSCYDPGRLVVDYVVKGPDRMGMSSGIPISAEFMGADADIRVYKVLGNFVGRSVNPSLNAGEYSHNINSPSSSPDVISVGATAYTTSFTDTNGVTHTYDFGSNGTVASFSSVGPTVDGRIKPDVMAPGANIISSSNSYFFELNPDTDLFSDVVDEYTYDGRTYYWKADTGTSMSSPAVGGAIALWLEAKPDLTREEIMEVFAHTCRHPDDTMSYPNTLYGYGQIDVYRGLQYILGIDGIDGISSYQPEGIDIDVLPDGVVRMRFDSPLPASASIKAYSISGQKLSETVVPAGATSSELRLSAARGTVVVLQVTGGSKVTAGSTLVRI